MSVPAARFSGSGRSRKAYSEITSSPRTAEFAIRCTSASLPRTGRAERPGWEACSGSATPREDPLRGKRDRKGDGKRIIVMVVLGIVVVAILLRRFAQLLH